MFSFVQVTLMRHVDMAGTLHSVSLHVPFVVPVVELHDATLVRVDGVPRLGKLAIAHGTELLEGALGHEDGPGVVARAPDGSARAPHGEQEGEEGDGEDDHGDDQLEYGEATTAEHGTSPVPIILRRQACRKFVEFSFAAVVYSRRP